MSDDDHDRIVRMETQIDRLLSDAESEKETRSRSNERIHADLVTTRGYVDSKYDSLRNYIDAKCEVINKQTVDSMNEVHAAVDQLRASVDSKFSRADKRVSWLERLAWGLLAIIAAFGWWVK